MKKESVFLILSPVLVFVINCVAQGQPQLITSLDVDPLTVNNNKTNERPEQEEEFFIDPVNGNRYRIVRIGDQVWMAENLKAVKFNDGSDIRFVSGNKEWANLSTPAYCWYKNDKALGEVYEALYNWYAVSTGKLCPKGWHVPTEADYFELVNNIGGEEEGGGKLKEAGTEHWNEPNEGATNETRFTALPGGFRFRVNGSFWNLGVSGSWWLFNEEELMCMSLNKNSSEVVRALVQGEKEGASVRCVKDK